MVGIQHAHASMGMAPATVSWILTSGLFKLTDSTEPVSLNKKLSFYCLRFLGEIGFAGFPFAARKIGSLNYFASLRDGHFG
jgi:hypothetical protein